MDNDTLREPDREAALRSIDRLAWLLDSSIPTPFGRTIGLDGIIGLIPGIGDAAGTVLSSIILIRAWRLGASRSVLTRMAMNVGLETVVGLVPVAGDLFDLAFKANRRNIALLRENFTDRPATVRRSRLTVALVFTGALLAIVLVAALAVAAGLALFRWIAG